MKRITLKFRLWIRLLELISIKENRILKLNDKRIAEFSNCTFRRITDFYHKLGNFSTTDEFVYCDGLGICTEYNYNKIDMETIGYLIAILENRKTDCYWSESLKVIEEIKEMGKK